MKAKPFSFATNALAIATASVAGILATGWNPVWVYLAVVNLWLLGLLAKDKTIAKHATTGKYRTPESTLLLLAALGGTPAMLAGMYGLRHKSSKAEFVQLFWGIIALQAVVAYLYRNELMGLIF